MRADAIDAALAPVLDGLGEARLREAPIGRFVELMTRVHEIWLWSGRDESVEHFATDEVTGTAWSLYRGTRWADLRALLAPCAPLYDGLAARLEKDPKKHIAYSAKCAQIFVFRSEAETDKTREWALAERALSLCSTHRNARLVLAHLLADRAINGLSTTWFPTAKQIDAATADVARAETLFPQSSRLGPAKAKLKEVTEKNGTRG